VFKTLKHFSKEIYEKGKVAVRESCMKRNTIDNEKIWQEAVSHIETEPIQEEVKNEQSQEKRSNIPLVEKISLRDQLKSYGTGLDEDDFEKVAKENNYTVNQLKLIMKNNNSIFQGISVKPLSEKKERAKLRALRRASHEKHK